MDGLVVKDKGMPLYEYECTQCKQHTEKIQKFSDREITACPHCGGLLERVVSAAAISFKGGGWFKDGYSHAKPKSSSEGDSKTKSASATSGDSGKSSGASIDASASSNKDAKSATPSAPAAPAAPASSTTDKK